MIRRRAVLGALSAVVASAVVVLAAGGGVAAENNTNLRAATVHSKLFQQLEANPTGGVTAVVTTWGRDGLDDITNLGVTGLKLKVLPMVITPSLTMAQLEKLQASPAVRSVWPQEQYETYMEDSTWITKARYVWNSSSSGPDSHRGFNVTGAGVELAMIDTGFDGLHEDGDNLIEFCNSILSLNGERQEVLCTPWVVAHNTGPAGTCGALFPGASNTGLGPTTAPPGCRNKARGDSEDPDVSHGTHVGGTILGTGHASGGKQFNHSTIGMAPDAKFRAYKAGTAVLLNTWTLAAYDDMTYKKEIGYSKVIAVNNSWGGGDGANYDPSDPTMVAVKRAYDAGIVSVFAAGNSGPEHNTLSAQCVSPYVVCVAASTKPDSVVGFSSKGRPSQPSDTNRDGVVNGDDVQPDNHDRILGQKLELGLYRPALTAPGVNINSMRGLALNLGDPGSAKCREDDLMPVDPKMFCYVTANGTSMATPHVTGAIGLIGQVLKQQGRNLKSSNLSRDIIDILERSANTSKLPAWESEEQGAGRLDVHQAIRYAKGLINLRKPNFGYPAPPYVNDQYPGQPAWPAPLRPGSDPSRFYDEDGCTTSGSWTVGSFPRPGGPVEPPPLVAPLIGYGQHFIEVPKNTDRLRITARWNTGDNFYLRLWRPGVNPDNEAAAPDAGSNQSGRPSAFFQSRVFPDQEAVGLVFTGNMRWLEARSPEEDNVGSRGVGQPPAEGPGEPPVTTTSPTLPAGTWILRVYHRAGGVVTNPPEACLGTAERPKRTAAQRYHLRVELPGVTYRPSVKIDTNLGNTLTQRFVEINGRAGYPPHTQKPTGVEETTPPPLGHVGYSWEGITNWEVPGSSQTGGDQPSVPTVPLYMHGQNDAHPPPTAIDALTCTGNGETDVLPPPVGCNGPFLMPKSTLSTKPTAAFWRTGIDDEIFDGTADRNIHDPNWSWCLAPGPGCPTDPTYTPAGTQTVSGPMTVEWWAACNLCDADIGISADWFIRVWADGTLRFQQRVTATPTQPGVASEVSATVTLPTFTATQRIVVQIDPVYIDSQTVTTIYYDSASSLNCPTDPSNPITPSACDSRVLMPATAGTGGGGGGNQPPATPENVRVTDLPSNPPNLHPYPSSPTFKGLRVAWDGTSTTGWEVRKSTDPLFPGGGTRITGPFVLCTSPQAPTPNQPPGHDRSGVCYTDTNVSYGTVYYYRVVRVQGTQRSANSEIAYGMPTKFDRQVKLKVDRLYGPQYWEYALLSPSPTPPDTENPGTSWKFFWDTLELTSTTFSGFPGPTFTPVMGPGGAHLVFARSFTQGIGSAKDGKASTLDDDPGPPPPPPDGGCPDDDDGDGDDDDDDDDSDDDGDDDDDDCEDDDDDEEEDDD
jgi:serine protease AprX